MGVHREAFEEFAEKASEELQDSLKELILYGSVARGEARKDSDVDVFAVVEDNNDLKRLRHLAYDIGVLDYGVSISVQGSTADEFEGFSNNSYLRNVSREGVRHA